MRLNLLLIIVLLFPFTACSKDNGSVDDLSETEKVSSVKFDEDSFRLLAPSSTVTVKLKNVNNNNGIEALTASVNCWLTKPDNAEALVALYNSTYTASAKLMPEEIYSVEKVAISKGDSNTTIRITINQDRVEAANSLCPFVLPLKVTTDSDKVAGGSEILYILCPTYTVLGAATRVHFSNTAASLDVYYKSAGDKAVICCPGGGYYSLTAGSIDMYISTFENQNVTCAVLNYRLPKGDYSLPVQDAKDAIDIMIAKKSDWGYSKLGIMGNSAGGHLASCMAVQEPDKLNFQILLFPVITMQSGKTHQGSFVQFFGSNPSTALIDEYSNELHVAANNPRAYVAYSLDDSTVLPVYNGMLYSSRLRETGVSVKEKTYSEGGHSWTLWSDYPKVMIDWLNGL